MRYIHFICLVMVLALFSCRQTKNAYICPPCNLECDDLTFFQPGQCPHCRMRLIKEEELTLNKIDIQTGAGYFQIEGNKGDTSRPITVFYYKPSHFTPDSRVLLVIPGTGRSAGSYRDSWITAAEKNGWLILSPMYPERSYGFEDYHLCGMVDESNVLDQVTYVEDTNYAQLDEEGLYFGINPHPSDWLFNDFDRIFDLAVKAVNSRQQHYTIFGHSAGGQILHKMALFSPQSKADKIIASNASFYTLPDSSVAFPFGLKNAPTGQVSLQQAFEKKLILLLGELDNAEETGGTFLRSPTADQQGLHRLARGAFFFNRAKEMADKSDYPFNWELIIVPGVGHDQDLMGAAAAAVVMDNI